jgi:hypothetical protein
MLLRRTTTTTSTAAARGPASAPAAAASIAFRRRAPPTSSFIARAEHQEQQRPPPAYPYQSPEGRNKATIEHIFSPASDTESSTEEEDDNNATSAARAAERRHQRSILSAQNSAPWGIGWQMSERNLVWNDDLKLRLIKRVAAQNLNIDEQELEGRLALLTPLLPRSLGPLLARASADTCVRLASNASVVASRLLRLKTLFPKADIEEMVAQRLSLLLDEDLDDVAAARNTLDTRVLVGPSRVCVDRFVEAFPVVLSARGVEFERAVEDAFRLLPALQPYESMGGVRDPEGAAALAQLLRTDPDKVIGMMKGSCLITYDQVSNPFTPAGGMVVNAPGTPG